MAKASSLDRNSRCSEFMSNLYAECLTLWRLSLDQYVGRMKKEESSWRQSGGDIGAS